MTEEQESSCCDFDHDIDDWCPQCCPNEGVFAGGTEECDFCEYASYCQQDMEK